MAWGRNRRAGTRSWGHAWYDYEPTVRRPAKDGLRAKSQRGSFSSTWWGKRWIQALETFGWANRLSRGRSYARSGQVVDLEVTSGQIEAKVQGSQPTPYLVRIALKPLSDPQWAKATAALAGQAAFSAQLLAGEMPQEIDEIMEEAEASLFPAAAKDLITSCSCPDSANPCKHVAAVHYLLAEEIDRDPFLLFTLRGRDREAVMRGLREARGAAEASPEAAPAAPGEEPLRAEGFWEIGAAMADWRVTPAPPAVPGGVLRRLGPPDFAEDPPGLTRRFEQIYARVTERAVETGLADAETPPETGDEASR